jgi:hypothetical protein
MYSEAKVLDHIHVLVNRDGFRSPFELCKSYIITSIRGKPHRLLTSKLIPLMSQEHFVNRLKQL